jgi:hypothetical protein
MRTTRVTTLLLAAAVLPAALGLAGGNLVQNGGFDDTADPLSGWTYDYTWTGNRLYAGNHRYVSIVPRDGVKKSVLKLHGTRDILWGTGQGVKVDSAPIPYEFGATYKLTAYARSQADSQEPGPNCRIYIEGYMWAPGIKPHENPKLHELRRIYKQGAGNILYFGSSRSGPFSNVSTKWQKGDCTFPDDDLSSLAMKHLKRVDFLVVHVIAIDGWDGDLMVDDIELVKVK